MVKEHPIIMSPGSVTAIRDGRKTHTLRVIVPEPKYTEYHLPEGSGGFWHWQPSERNFISHWPDGAYKYCRYGQVGDTLWVKETWASLCNLCLDGPCEYPDETPCPSTFRQYKADRPNDPYPGDWPAEYAKGNPEAPKWRSSLYMPKWACRLRLTITGLKAIQLEAVDEEILVAEGSPVTGAGAWEWFIPHWDALNARRGYPFDSNPWVWAIAFKVKDGAK